MAKRQKNIANSAKQCKTVQKWHLGAKCVLEKESDTEGSVKWSKRARKTKQQKKTKNLKKCWTRNCLGAKSRWKKNLFLTKGDMMTNSAERGSIEDNPQAKFFQGGAFSGKMCPHLCLKEICLSCTFHCVWFEKKWSHHSILLCQRSQVWMAYFICGFSSFAIVRISTATIIVCISKAVIINIFKVVIISLIN